MNTIIHTTKPNGRARPPDVPEDFRQPNYDCREQTDNLRLLVYLPGVDASGVQIEARGPDLTVTARKSRYVRPNFSALHIEKVQRDYRLRLRLGHDFDYPEMQAEIRDGMLTVTVPKRLSAAEPFRRVA